MRIIPLAIEKMVDPAFGRKVLLIAATIFNFTAERLIKPDTLRVTLANIAGVILTSALSLASWVHRHLPMPATAPAFWHSPKNRTPLDVMNLNLQAEFYIALGKSKLASETVDAVAINRGMKVQIWWL